MKKKIDKLHSALPLKKIKPIHIFNFLNMIEKYQQRKKR